MANSVDPNNIAVSSVTVEQIKADVLSEIAQWNELRRVPESYLKMIIGLTLLQATRRGFTERPAPNMEHA